MAEPTERTLAIETRGLDVVPDADRRGRARDLFWPWFGANVSVLGLSYGSFALGFGISFGQALVAGIVGVLFSFLLCGLVAIAGKRGSAPTMVLSRAAFGVRGNRFPAALCWLLTVGWETVLTALATLATATVFERLGWGGGPVTKVLALVVVAALVVAGGVAGFDAIMRMQRWITWITGVLTVVYVVLAAPSVDLAAVAERPAGSAAQFLGALIFLMTGFGLSWVNTAADYSRYLPRRTGGVAVAGWTTFGGALAPLLLVGFGLLLAGSSPELNAGIAADPIGALTGVLPLWFLLPFALVAVLGLVGGAVLDIYSSGLALLAAGVRIPRPAAALLDGALMVLGTVYLVFLGGEFLGQFQGFLTTLGVPIAAWCGVLLADVLLRRRDYAEPELYDPRGRYGSVRPAPILLVLVATAVGWGLVTNAAAGWLGWQGYLLAPLGLGGRDGAWAAGNVGVLVALVLGFAATLATRSRIRGQESG